MESIEHVTDILIKIVRHKKVYFIDININIKELKFCHAIRNRDFGASSYRFATVLTRNTVNLEVQPIAMTYLGTALVGSNSI